MQLLPAICLGSAWLCGLLSCQQSADRDQHLTKGSPALEEAIAEARLDSGYTKLPGHSPVAFVPDTSLNGIVLFDSVSLSQSIRRGLVFKGGVIQKADLQSADGTQRCALTRLPGSYRYDIASFEVLYDENGSMRDPQIADSSFRTENGLRLGLSRSAILGLKGEPDSTSNDGKRFFYAFRNTSSPFMRRVNIPTYGLRMAFVGDTLVYFWFGFDNP